MESADQAVAEVNREPRRTSCIRFDGLISVLIIFFLSTSKLNGTTVGDVHIKVSIARKQPMLDAATGKSVWASLGKLITLTLLFPCSSSSLAYLPLLCPSFAAVQNSSKGSYRDKRNQVVYSEDFL